MAKMAIHNTGKPSLCACSANSVLTLESYNIPITVVTDACFVSLFSVTMTLTNCDVPSWKLYLCHTSVFQRHRLITFLSRLIVKLVLNLDLS